MLYLKVSDVTTSICSYESDGSRHSFTQRETYNRLQCSPGISQDIESMKSVSPAPSQASSSSKVKASDWVKTLNLKTPSKDSQSGDMDILEDSAKKKKRFTRGGFADQLNKVQTRERSSLRIWSHQQKCGKSESTDLTHSKYITITVVSFELLYSLQLAQCEVLAGPMDQGEILVLFSTAAVQQQNIKPGSIVRIHRPWQQLELKQTQQKVLLCTNYCHVDNSNDLQIPRSQKFTKQEVVTGQWNCPCVADLVNDYQSCAAHLLPCIPAIDIPLDAGFCDSKEVSDTSRLTMVQSTQLQNWVTSSTHTILDSIQGSPPTSFTGLVQRVIQTRQTSRWCVLVEDVQGTLCQVIISTRIPVWDKVLEGEGSVFSFTGLTVKSRTHRDRDVDLFSLIDSVWSGVVTSTNSQDSDQRLPSPSSQDSDQRLPAPSSQDSDQRLPGPSSQGSELPGTSTAVRPVESPGFCYVMNGDNSADIDVTSISNSVLLSRYQRLSLTDLSETCKELTAGKRFCFVGKVLAILPSDTQHIQDDSRTTTHTRNPHCYLYVRAASWSTTIIVRVAYDITHDTCGQVMFFKDVFYLKEQLCCDVLSQILPVSAVPERCLSTNCQIDKEIRALQGEIILPSVCCELPDLTLCKVLGRVRGVDESSAYSWDVCDDCGSDSLVTQQRELICQECHKAVTEPVNKMTMEIHMTCDELDIPVTVSLLQDTIECLLPEETTEEGYDIESVLGKDVGTIYCVLCSKLVGGGKVKCMKLQQVAVVL
ncbi:DNA repair-scaffolding protein-like [Ylistrum balloti]|uniref:DNA repair-scaffolding protein-like n=1 Tax=Ylistrum balloti TaxID=509963 RepID=UPI0029057E4E|nr:DNA repair-scaffolding protein-like [Ylistrum balloti]